MKILRNIIEIDEERCTGCGQCVLDCAEHAIAIIDGKAKVISDILCDGLGACLSGCPENALRIVQREAAPFDEQAVHALQQKKARAKVHGEGGCSCPGATALQIPLAPPTGAGLNGHAMTFAHWPVKLRLVPPNGPFLQGADLLLVADCAPVACRHFHQLAEGKIVLTACPKFEDNDAITQKLSAIAATNRLKSLDVIRMEVPCCGGLESCSQAALQIVPHAPPLTQRVMGCGGQEMPSK